MKPWFFALILIGSLNAFAGTSTQDPNIARLRDDFTNKAKSITAADLKLEQNYDCYMFQAWKDAFEIVPSKVSFWRIDGILLYKIDYGSQYSPDYFGVREEQGKISVKIPKSKSSTPGNELNFRSDGVTLYIEQSASPTISGEDKSPSNEKASTQNYRVCAVPLTPSANERSAP